MYCRRVQPEVVKPGEKATVESAVRAAGFSDFIVDIKRNAVTVYMPDLDAESLSDLAVALGLPRIKIPPEAAAKVFKPIQTYTPMMRFLLKDKKERRFVVERYCFLGGIDDWIHVDGPADHKRLANKYCRHLDEDSFYDL